MTARFSQNQGNTRGHRPRLQSAFEVFHTPLKSYPTQILAIAALCVAAYACCLNNGFISDDYENVRLAEGLKSDFWYLFTSPPLNFRMTSFLAYTLLDHLFPQHYEFFYTA